ncbi:MAG: hydroxyacid aldolase [Methylobacteriaceae bacterium]|nr:hydroxyacid aldolase [Methylobacteriaceae bacterium]MBV9701219.1 hydroxyacid aldolase [Methylobacteriaceae bacterium]
MAAGGVVGLLAERIRAGECLFTAWVGLPEATIPELLVGYGFDTATLDMQHGAYDVATAIRGIAAVALMHKPTIVRVAVGDFATASRMLDHGAAAIIAPMINSVADAKAFVSFTKFPPVGDRSWGPRRVLTLTGLDHPGYLAAANSFQLAIAMIETREAIAALDDILAVPGIDGVFVGPSDLAIALTDGATVDPHSKAVDEALHHVCARAKAHGKFAAAYCFTGARAKELAERGFSLCSIASDALLMRGAALAELKAAH